MYYRRRKVNEMHADMVLVNGKIVTMDPSDSIAEAVAVKYSRLLKVGTNREVQGLVGEGTKVIDLKGRCVIPGARVNADIMFFL